MGYVERRVAYNYVLFKKFKRHTVAFAACVKFISAGIDQNFGNAFFNVQRYRLINVRVKIQTFVARFTVDDKFGSSALVAVSCYIVKRVSVCNAAGYDCITRGFVARITQNFFFAHSRRIEIVSLPVNSRVRRAGYYCIGESMH